MLGLEAPLPRQFTHSVIRVGFSPCVSLQSGLGFLTVWWLGSKKECPKSQEVEAARFLWSGPGEWYSVTSVEFCAQTVKDPRFKVMGFCFHLSMEGVSKNF